MNNYFHFPQTTEELKTYTIRQLYKDYRCTVELLHDMETMRKNGSSYHLGDPINKKIYDHKKDLIVLTNYITSIGRDVTKIKTNVPVKPSIPAPVITIDETQPIAFTSKEPIKATDKVIVRRRISDDSPILKSDYATLLATGKHVKFYSIPAAFVNIGEDIFIGNFIDIIGFRIR